MSAATILESLALGMLITLYISVMFFYGGYWWERGRARAARELLKKAL